MGRPLIDMTGKRVGQLFVLRRVKDRSVGKTNHKEVWYRVKCDCGRILSMRGYLLRQDRVYSCGHARNVTHGLCGTKEYSLWAWAKKRAKNEGIYFTLKPTDVCVPKVCPLLGISLQLTNHVTRFNSPTIDRIIPTKGYTRNNTWVISHKANTIKNNASLRDLRMMARNLEKKLWPSSI